MGSNKTPTNEPGPSPLRGSLSSPQPAFSETRPPEPCPGPLLSPSCAPLLLDPTLFKVLPTLWSVPPLLTSHSSGDLGHTCSFRSHLGPPPDWSPAQALRVVAGVLQSAMRFRCLGYGLQGAPFTGNPVESHPQDCVRRALLDSRASVLLGSAGGSLLHGPRSLRLSPYHRGGN